MNSHEKIVEALRGMGLSEGTVKEIEDLALKRAVDRTEQVFGNLISPETVKMAIESRDGEDFVRRVMGNPDFGTDRDPQFRRFQEFMRKEGDAGLERLIRENMAHTPEMCQTCPHEASCDHKPDPASERAFKGTLETLRAVDGQPPMTVGDLGEWLRKNHPNLGDRGKAPFGEDALGETFDGVFSGAEKFDDADQLLLAEFCDAVLDPVDEQVTFGAQATRQLTVDQVRAGDDPRKQLRDLFKKTTHEFAEVTTPQRGQEGRAAELRRVLTLNNPWVEPYLDGVSGLATAAWNEMNSRCATLQRVIIALSPILHSENNAVAVGALIRDKWDAIIVFYAHVGTLLSSLKRDIETLRGVLADHREALRLR
jgi:hypothetical protein